MDWRCSADSLWLSAPFALGLAAAGSSMCSASITPLGIAYKTLGAGLATIALAGVGAGIGIIFGSLIHSVSQRWRVGTLALVTQTLRPCLHRFLRFAHRTRSAARTWDPLPWRSDTIKGSVPAWLRSQRSPPHSRRCSASRCSLPLCAGRTPSLAWLSPTSCSWCWLWLYWGAPTFPVATSSKATADHLWLSRV